MPEGKTKKWIFDTVVLSNFLLSKSDWLLKKRYHAKGLITSQVMTEIGQGIAKGYPLTNIENFLMKSQFEIVDLDKVGRKIFTSSLSHIGSGEASCIAYAANANNCIVVSDDKKARLACREYGILVTGTIGILKACCVHNIVSPEDADGILKTMIANGFYSPVKSINCLL